MSDIAPDPGGVSTGEAGRGVSVWAGILLFTLALTAGMSLKVMAGRTLVQQVDHSGAVKQFLEQYGYGLKAIKGEIGSTWITAVTGSGCQINVIQARPEGWDQYAIRQAATADDDFFVVFQGWLYDAHPTWLVKGYSFLDRARSRLGFAVPPRPVLAVITSSTCSARDLPWRELNMAPS